MKFGQQLQLGIYESWKEYYIQYNRLKRLIVRLKFLADKEGHKNKIDVENHKKSFIKKEKLRKGSSEDERVGDKEKSISDETTPLTLSSAESHDYGVELSAPKFNTHVEKERNISSDKAGHVDFFEEIKKEIEKVNKFYVGKAAEIRNTIDSIVQKRKHSYVSHHTSSSELNDIMKLRDAYVELTRLKSYVDLNKTGFYKIVKKYDKTMESSTLELWLPVVDNQPFVTSSDISELMEILTGIVSRDKLLEWERFAQLQQSIGQDDIFPAVRPTGLVISLLIFVTSLYVPWIQTDSVQSSRCLSLLLFAISLWITEAIPYFATAMLIPVLVTLLGVLKDPTDPTKSMSHEMAAAFVLDHIFNHTTMLLLGGYTISTAFSRCQLELRISSYLQQRLGNSPQLFILAIMLLGLFLSMWISNHTAPILCAAIILPIVRDFPTDSRFSRALLLGLAFGSNFGGMMTPISSLQNALAVSYLEQVGVEVSFGRWIGVALPFCVMCTVIAWMVILILMKPYDVTSIPVIVFESNTELFTKKNITVIGLSGLTILLFATSSFTKIYFGDIGIISLCFVGWMFGSGLLTEVDFNSLSWHTLFLVGGGNVLGKAVESSGLLSYLAQGIILGNVCIIILLVPQRGGNIDRPSLPLDHPWMSLLIILCFAGVVATFVSHTVASIILMPIISKIGVTLGMPEVMVVSSAFAVSAAMALPFSSFPNVNSLLIVDDFQKPYLNVYDFLLTGVPMSILSVALIATIGVYLISNILVA